MRIKLLSAALAAVAAIGLLHMPWARPLLRKVSGCPVPRLSPAQIEAAQVRAFHKLRGQSRAPEHPALGFDLESEGLAEVQEWARQRGLSCDLRREGALLVCPNVPSFASPAGAAFTYDELAFGFRVRDGKLVNLTALRTGLPEPTARVALRVRGEELSRALGVPESKTAGENAYVAFRFADYLAEASAMPLPGRGYALREHYMSALE
jgi:hypothetical protein